MMELPLISWLKSSTLAGAEESGSTFPWNPRMEMTWWTSPWTVQLEFQQAHQEPGVQAHQHHHGELDVQCTATWTTRKKTPSQLRRDQKRREDFIAKKAAIAKVKVEVIEPSVIPNDSNPTEIEDEIELTEISDEAIKLQIG